MKKTLEYKGREYVVPRGAANDTHAMFGEHCYRGVMLLRWVTMPRNEETAEGHKVALRTQTFGLYGDAVTNIEFVEIEAGAH